MPPPEWRCDWLEPGSRGSWQPVCRAKKQLPREEQKASWMPTCLDLGAMFLGFIGHVIWRWFWQHWFYLEVEKKVFLVDSLHMPHLPWEIFSTVIKQNILKITTERLPRDNSSDLLNRERESCWLLIQLGHLGQKRPCLRVGLFGGKGK